MNREKMFPGRPFVPGYSFIAVLVLAACVSSEPEHEVAPSAMPAVAAAPRAEQVETHRVELRRIPAPIEASGSVEARRVSRIGAEVGGRLLQVSVDIGDSVEAGDMLFRIDPLPYEMALAEARAGLSLARAERDNALQERDRVERLIEERATSQQRRDNQKTAAAVATARVAQMEARLQRARTDLVRTQVRAPYAGSIVDRLAHEGEMAGSDPVVVLQESGALVVVLNIPEATHAPIRRGSRVRIFVEGQSDPIETQVDRVSDRVDPATRTYEVRAPVNGATGAVKAGSYVRAEVLPADLAPRPVVDRSALLMRDGRTFVFKFQDGVARQLAVETGAVTAKWAEILTGVGPGDIVVRGEVVARLVDGEHVEALPERTSAGPGEAL